MPTESKARRPHKSGSVRPMGRQWEGRFYPEKGPRVEKLLGVRKEVDPDNGITETEETSSTIAGPSKWSPARSSSRS